MTLPSPLLLLETPSSSLSSSSLSSLPMAPRKVSLYLMPPLPTYYALLSTSYMCSYCAIAEYLTHVQKRKTQCKKGSFFRQKKRGKKGNRCLPQYICRRGYLVSHTICTHMLELNPFCLGEEDEEQTSGGKGGGEGEIET